MTSEVLVMNRLAVALAADSAVTISDGQRDKVLNSANKLFMLSRRHPVGVMIYSNASFLRVPWEAIIKLFRAHLGDTQFDTVADYGGELIKFLNANLWMFPDAAQRDHVEELTEALFAELLRKIRLGIAKELTYWEEGSLSPAAQAKQRQKIAQDVISKMHAEWINSADSDTIAKANADEVHTPDSADFNKRVLKSFQKYAVDGPTVHLLRELLKALIYKEPIPYFLRSGVVIAGFGNREIFPSFQHYRFGGIYKNKIKSLLVSQKSVSKTEPGIVEPFADSGMANVFLKGITEELDAELLRRTYHVIKRTTDEVIDSLPRLSKKRRLKMKADLDPLQLQAASDWYAISQAAQQKAQRRVAQEGIAPMPVDQLAHIAASFVNLNSFRKKISLGPETVGGPVDVAVITKGDGFIWIDRKHYFKRELNEHYFRNAHYVMGDSDKSGGQE